MSTTSDTHLYEFRLLTNWPDGSTTNTPWNNCTEKDYLFYKNLPPTNVCRLTKGAYSYDVRTLMFNYNLN